MTDPADREAQPAPPLDSALAALCGYPRGAGDGAERLAEYAQRCGYAALLPQIGVPQLVAFLSARPDCVEDWFRWAAQHSLRCGPYLVRAGNDCRVGLYDSSGIAFQSLRLFDPVRACAEFIALELGDPG